MLTGIFTHRRHTMQHRHSTRAGTRRPKGRRIFYFKRTGGPYLVHIAAFICVSFFVHIYSEAMADGLKPLKMSQPASTTVVTMCGRQDDAGNDSDEQSPDGCDGKRTN
jgi:hypothetical protein